MNLKHLNLDLHNIPEDAEIQVSVFLIASDLKTRKLVHTMTSIGCDSCFCVSDLCDLVLAIVDLKIVTTTCTIFALNCSINIATT